MVTALLAIALFASAPADSTPFDRFAFRYERPPAEMIDTVDGTIASWSCGEPPVRGKAKLSKGELRTIYDRLMRLQIFELPTPSPAIEPKARDDRRPRRLYVRAGSTIRSFEWTIRADQESSDEWRRLADACAFLDSVLYAQPEYKRLPRSKEQCFDTN